MSDISATRKQAWETRRKKYGQAGHSRGAYGHSGDHVASMQALLIRLHEEGVLSEGQVSKATGLHRITVRKMADDYRNSLPSPSSHFETLEAAARRLSDDLRGLGAQMSNALYNLAQTADMSIATREAMKELTSQWDAAVGGTEGKS